MKTALIIGSEGQDGTLLKLLLASKQYEVFGIGREAADKSNAPATYIQLDLSGDDFTALEQLISSRKPAEIYFVAAFHQSTQEQENTGSDNVSKYIKVNQLAFIRVLEICRIHSPASRIIYTSSSLIFASSGIEVQNENTLPAPGCLYSLSKVLAAEAANYYRARHQLFVSVGIMYNHESVLRSDKFLSKKIILQTKQWINRETDIITVADLASVSDWGYAPDYVEAMWHILQLESPGVYIVSSAKPHSVQDWIETLFQHLQRDWRDVVVEDKSLMIRRKPVLIGDNSKLLATGWKPRVSFEEMVIKMYNNII